NLQGDASFSKRAEELNARETPQGRGVIHPKWIGGHDCTGAASLGVLRQLGSIIAVRKSEACAGRAGFCTHGCDTLFDFHACVRPRFTSENGMRAAVSAERKPARVQPARVVP